MRTGRIGRRPCGPAGRMRRFFVSSPITEPLETRRLLAAPPVEWLSRGPGGGGALFAPSFSPHDPQEMYVVTDMSEVFRSQDLGASWSAEHFEEIQGGRQSFVRFTSDPAVRYALDYTEINGGSEAVRPSKSTDGGATWTPLAAWDESEPAYSVHADPDATNRLIASDYGTLYFSGDGGAAFAPKYTAAGGLYVAGAFFDGPHVYVGVTLGNATSLLVSHDGGATFAPSPVGGIPAGQALVSFAGAKENGVTRFFGVTLPAGDVYPGMLIEKAATDYQGIYSLDVGQPTWTPRTTGIAAGEYPAFVSMARGEIDVAYVAGTNDGGYPTVHKTTNGGGGWSLSFRAQNNQNVATGWQGQGGDSAWSFGELAMSFAVSPADPNKAAVTDFGFVHLTTDGGATWRQAYTGPADSNPPGAPTPKHKPYHGVGLEPTSTLSLAWADAETVVAGYTDITGVRSTDGGASWSFPDYGSLRQNTIYRVVRHPTTGTVYAATSSVHDLYQSTYLTDARIDGGTGRVLMSNNQGASWQLLHDFGRPVVWAALDPNNPSRMYASVVHSTQGGIFVSNNINLGAASTWTKLANPPRTQGHPFNIHVLNDGTLVCTYAARRQSNGVFTASSGVFISTDGGASWADRTAANMRYYTKDLTVDPTDPAQNTWYAAVRMAWGGVANGTGGLYKTTDRGVNWVRVFDGDSAESATIHPATGEMYLSTLSSGLWYSPDVRVAAPAFTQLDAYPFRQPERVFINPFDPAEVWVTSFGYGLAVGRTGPTPPASSVAGRHVFYNRSVYDGSTAGTPDGPDDDDAIAPGKEALLPGDTATFANYTGYGRGINGVMVDVLNLPDDRTVTADDFAFNVGNAGAPSGWPTAPLPSAVTVRRGAGTGGSDRVTIAWPDGAVRNTWLRVTVLANDDTGLTAPDVFYFGNVVGETFNSAAQFRVDSRDVARTRNAQRKPATIQSLFDHNRDGRVNSADVLLARNNQRFALGPITPSVVAPDGAAAAAATTTAATTTAVAQQWTRRAMRRLADDLPAPTAGPQG